MTARRPSRGRSGSRGAVTQRSFDFWTALVGRDWTPVRELSVAAGVGYRTALRYAQAAERAGLVEYRQGDGARAPRGEAVPGLVRLVDARLRRPRAICV